MHALPPSPTLRFGALHPKFEHKLEEQAASRNYYDMAITLTPESARTLLKSFADELGVWKKYHREVDQGYNPNYPSLSHVPPRPTIKPEAQIKAEIEPKLLAIAKKSSPEVVLTVFNTLRDMDRDLYVVPYSLCKALYKRLG